MKPNRIVLFCLLALTCVVVSCKTQPQDEQYPKTTIVGERTIAGTIVHMPMPATTEPPLPGMQLGLDTASGDYILILDGHWLAQDNFTVEDVVYSVEDDVEITGTVSEVQLSPSENYLNLEIATIRKIN